MSNNLIQKSNAQKLVLLGLAERAVLLHPIVENLLFRHPPARTTVRSWRLSGKRRRWGGRKAKGPCQRNRRLARCSLSRLTRQEARPIRWHPSTGHVSFPFSIVVAAAHSESHQEATLDLFEDPDNRPTLLLSSGHHPNSCRTSPATPFGVLVLRSESAVVVWQVETPCSRLTDERRLPVFATNVRP